MKRILKNIITFYAAMLCGQTLMAASIGQWDFNSSNLVQTAGANLGDLTYADAATTSQTVFGSNTAFGIANIGGSAATLMRFPVNTNGMGYRMSTPAANGGGSTVNQYTLILDVFYPAASDGKTRPLIQTVDTGAGLGGEEFIVIEAPRAVLGRLKLELAV